MLTDLKAARRAEAQAIQALLIQGQQLRRVLEQAVGEPLLSAGVRSLAKDALKLHLAATRRYADASAARAIARQRPVVAGDRPKSRTRSKGNAGPQSQGE